MFSWPNCCFKGQQNSRFTRGASLKSLICPFHYANGSGHHPITAPQLSEVKQNVVCSRSLPFKVRSPPAPLPPRSCKSQTANNQLLCIDGVGLASERSGISRLTTVLLGSVVPSPCTLLCPPGRPLHNLSPPPGMGGASSSFGSPPQRFLLFYIIFYFILLIIKKCPRLNNQ